jgi:hypothetical protein
MARYSSAINQVTLNTSNDSRTIVTTASGSGSQVKVYEFAVAGLAGSSTPCSIAVNRSTGGTTGSASGTIAVAKLSPTTPTNACSVFDTWSAQPTLVTGDVINPTFNAFGGGFKFMAIPGGEILVLAQGAAVNLSFRSRVSTASVSGHILFEEA